MADSIGTQAKTLKAQATAVRRSTEAQEDSADRRTELAADRTVLAAERTYAAWVRTGLAALASGVGARTLLDKVAPTWLAVAAGVVLTAYAGFCFAAGVWRDFLPVAPPRPDAHHLPRALLLCVNGFLVLVVIAALIGELWAKP